MLAEALIVATYAILLEDDVNGNVLGAIATAMENIGEIFFRQTQFVSIAGDSYIGLKMLLVMTLGN